jgi:hypothetical protein
MKLAAGDLCVVVDHPQWFILSEKKYIGWHVVLIKPVECRWADKWGQRWLVSGIPLAGIEVSEAVLRRVPPADLGLDVLTEEEVSL